MASPALVFVLCVLASVVAVECRCDAVYTFGSRDKIKLDTLHKKLQSAADPRGMQMERKGSMLRVCDPRNAETVQAFLCDLMEMEDDSPWIHQFGTHDANDSAWSATTTSDAKKDVLRRATAYHSWGALLREMTSVAACR